MSLNMKKTIYIFNEGDLKRKDNTIYFQGKEGKKYLPAQDISDIYVMGEISITKKFLEFCTANHITLHFFNYFDYYVGSYCPREQYNSGYMLVKQVENYIEIEKRKELAYQFIEGADKNIITVLKYYNNRGKNLESYIKDIEQLLSKLKGQKTIEQMMAIEGNVREIYYSAFDEILRNNKFVFQKRTKRPPRNKLNSLISFGNSVLYTIILSEIYNTHLDPRIGYLHSSNNRRFTLNLDVAEIFKPVIVDRTIFTLISKNMIQEKHFEEKLGGTILKEEGRKIFIAQLEEKLRTTVTQKELSNKVSYKRLIRMELYKIERHLMGEKQYIPYTHKW